MSSKKYNDCPESDRCSLKLVKYFFTPEAKPCCLLLHVHVFRVALLAGPEARRLGRGGEWSTFSRVPPLQVQGRRGGGRGAGRALTVEASTQSAGPRGGASSVILPPPKSRRHARAVSRAWPGGRVQITMPCQPTDAPRPSSLLAVSARVRGRQWATQAMQATQVGARVGRPSRTCVPNGCSVGRTNAALARAEFLMRSRGALGRAGLGGELTARESRPRLKKQQRSRQLFPRLLLLRELAAAACECAHPGHCVKPSTTRGGRGSPEPWHGQIRLPRDSFRTNPCIFFCCILNFCPGVHAWGAAWPNRGGRRRRLEHGGLERAILQRHSSRQRCDATPRDASPKRKVVLPVVRVFQSFQHPFSLHAVPSRNVPLIICAWPGGPACPGPGAGRREREGKQAGRGDVRH